MREQRVDGGDRPVAGEAQMRAGLAQGAPGEGPGLAGLAQERHHLVAGIAERPRGVERLHRGDDAQLLEARHVGGVDQLDMLDAVAAVARAVGGAGGGVGVERAAHAGVADRVDGDLEAQPVGEDDGLRRSAPA